ncbi:Panacea domain-containing protein [Thioalkalivibrio sp. HK1]|uniref:Panacea domain-containing protein n=1 Tax=Thioalkalivibrio sp. HK1 TaxID=1469245 RepID=UPI00046F3E60|nr:type II toxin-antitoxin system antitoxin SocA domain-containing protein [Thioalkalivibrio sp. HK1]
MNPSVFDVARYILEKRSDMTAMKLQKLVYYAQCWSLVWDERPLFDERIEAWMNGPVCPALYRIHRGKFKVGIDDIEGDSDRLDDEAKATIDAVLDFYADRSAQWLSDLSHLEDPWKKARERAKVAPAENSDEIITCADMHEYYCGIRPADDHRANA